MVSCIINRCSLQVLIDLLKQNIPILSFVKVIIQVDPESVNGVNSYTLTLYPSVSTLYCTFGLIILLHLSQLHS